MKTIKLKSDHSSLNVYGIGQVTDDNITPELYDRLIVLSPAHADFFEVIEIETAVDKPKRAPKSE